MEITYTYVKDYYGKILKSNKDLKTSACCPNESMPGYLQSILRDIHPEVLEKFYGCGSPIPFGLEGKTVVDLGSGSGRDSFILSKLVGEQGRVIGVDMTDEQLRLANSHLEYHQDKFGFKNQNVSFVKGFMENLDLPNNSIDVVVSNCVINLSPDKKRVFSEILRILKPGGELFFSDVFSSRRIPGELFSDPILLGECLGGALYVEDFRRILLDLGIMDYRVVSNSKISLLNEEIKKKVGPIDFYSMTLRVFKLDLEDRCEDYGQVAVYLGDLKDSPHIFILDENHFFEKNHPTPVCSNTARMLSRSRYASLFNIIGEEKTHFGLFDCTPTKKDESLGTCC